MFYSTRSSTPSSSPVNAKSRASEIEDFKLRYKNEPEFLQAYSEIADSLSKLFDEQPRYFECFKFLSEPERIIQFRVVWQDDFGKLQCNRGYRVQFNSALGPYKGGIRLHPSVNLSVLKFLGFEQIFKNSLTGLQMGGAKGGSDFDPKGKSDLEVRSFCQAFMSELFRHIGHDTDVPAGDIGTGAREIGFLYGQYHKLRNCHHGVLTGKGESWGGSNIRPEATGYGAVYFAEELYNKFKSCSLKGKKCLVSGSGNAAQYTCEKLIACGATVLTCSDTSGTLEFPDGMTQAQVEEVMNIKNVKRGRLADFQCSGKVKYHAGKQPWLVAKDCEIAFPAATQNELCSESVDALLKMPSFECVVEVSNMSTTPEGIEKLNKANKFYCPGKAANAGGVAVSGLEMSQNAGMIRWSREEVDSKLKHIMASIFADCVKYGKLYGKGENDIMTGANVAGFVKVANAMLDQGIF